MQYGFVIDQTRCIGCHACTVACKSENAVPLGSFRTWVKYTEAGNFPEVRRSFTVLRCNQCTAAPCVEICPVAALGKRTDGIVDVDPAICIGCKACMQACPYDALYLNEDSGTAQKCHFCAHRVEQGLAPACTAVCPTEALIPGDFDDPKSRVSEIRAAQTLQVRKPEAGTGPNVFYLEAAEAGLDPLKTNAGGGFLWAEQTAGPRLDAETFRRLESKAGARTTYDVPRAVLWGRMVSAYLLTKSLAAGVALAALAAGAAGRAAPLAALLFLLLTAGLLVGDLKRPERFLLILLRPQWKSWLCKGAVVLTAFGALLSAWALGWRWAVPTAVAATLAAGYTAWLFAQAKGRVLWMKRGLFAHLVVQAALAGAAFLLLAPGAFGIPSDGVVLLRWGLGAALLAHLSLTLLEPRLAPAGREREYAETVRLLSHGPYARTHWGLGVGLGVLLPLLLLGAAGPALWSVAGGLALVGLAIEEDLLVQAGQALPIS